jgi:hypothetical protein
VCIAVKVQSASGEIEVICKDKFRRRFGVQYTPTLLLADDLPIPLLEDEAEPEPKESERRHLELAVAKALCAKDSDAVADLPTTWLYGNKVRVCYVADVYIAWAGQEVGHGLVAGQDFAPGEMIAEYTGLARPRRYGDDGNNYLFGYWYPSGAGIDASRFSNVTRFINDGGERRNTGSLHVFVDGVAHIVLIAVTPIPEGSPILIDYGPRYWLGQNPPIDLGKEE